MRSKFLAIGICLVLVGLLVGVGCPRVAQGPSISVEKLVSVDGGVTWHDAVEQDVCQNVLFQITVTNDGTESLTNIDINDTLPDCLEFVDGPAVEICRTQASELPLYNLAGTHTPNWKCTEGLETGQSAEVIYTAHVVCVGNHCDTVSVEGEYHGQILTDVDCAVVVGIGNPNISIEKMVSADDGITWEEEVEQNVGQSVQFQITVTNDGTAPLADIVVTDSLSGCLEYVGFITPPAPSIQNNNLVWDFDGPLQPTDSIVIIFSAEVVELGMCDNEASVMVDYEGQLVSDEDIAVVEGICAVDLVEITVCECHNASTEATYPSVALLHWIDINYATRNGQLVEQYRGSRDCDEGGIDQYWAHTFILPETPTGCHIESAELEITVKRDGGNDALLVGFIQNDDDSWSCSRPLSDWMATGDIDIITLDLSDVYGDGSNVSFLDIMEIGFLDVAVQDDSPVGCATLTITYEPD